MKRRFVVPTAVALAALAMVGSAEAASLTGDLVNVTVNHGIQTSFTVGGACQVYQNLGVAIGGGIEAGAANDVGGGCGGGISVNIDGDALTITLDNADAGAGDYRWVEILIDGIDLEDVAGVSLVSNEVFTLGGAGSVIPDPSISFTESSIRILFDPPFGAVFDVTPDTGKTTVFQITTRTTDVPEPATLALLGLGLAGLASFGRRRAA